MLQECFRSCTTWAVEFHLWFQQLHSYCIGSQSHVADPVQSGTASGDIRCGVHVQCPVLKGGVNIALVLLGMFEELHESNYGLHLHPMQLHLYFMGSWSHAANPVWHGVATENAWVVAIFSIGYWRDMQIFSWCSRNVGGAAMKVLWDSISYSSSYTHILLIPSLMLEVL